MDRRKVLKQLPLAIMATSHMPTLWQFAAGIRRDHWSPVTDAERDLEVLVDTILPRTTTPGALDAEVPAFIQAALPALVTADEKADFYAQLDRFTNSAKSKFGAPFHLLDTGQKPKAMELLIASDPSFFRTLKYWTLTGYYTSRVGMTNALNYNQTPGRYEPCVEVSADTRTEASYF